MSVKELKEVLMTEIKATDDAELLEDVLLHLQRRRSAASGRDEPVYVLSSAQQTAVQRGLDDAAAGRIRAHEEADAEFERWIGEQEGEWGGR